jgi:hypothetical protein
MPRTCLACASPERANINKALAIGTPLRDIAGQYGISRSALDRHKSHVRQAIIKVQQKREEKIGFSVFDGIKALQGKALELLGKMESDGDYRGAVLAARGGRESLLAANELLTRAEALKGEGQLAFRVEFIGGKKAEPGERDMPVVIN